MSSESCPCGARMIPANRWRRMPLAQRRHARTLGLNYHAGRGLCCACFERVRGLDDRPERLTYARAELLAEWDLLYDRSRSRAANCRLIAPRLGMTYAALEKAITRASVQGAIAC